MNELDELLRRLRVYLGHHYTGGGDEAMIDALEAVVGRGWSPEEGEDPDIRRTIDMAAALIQADAMKGDATAEKAWEEASARFGHVSLEARHDCAVSMWLWLTEGQDTVDDLDTGWVS